MEDPDENAITASVYADAERYGWSAAERGRVLIGKLLSGALPLNLSEPGGPRNQPRPRPAKPALTLDELADYVLSRARPSGNERGCILWTGGASKKGYGRFRARGKLYSPHRVVLERKIGREMRRNEDTCHACDVPRCVNEAHLFVGSRQDNVADAMKKGRHPVPVESRWKPGEQGFVRVARKEG